MKAPFPFLLITMLLLGALLAACVPVATTESGTAPGEDSGSVAITPGPVGEPAANAVPGGAAGEELTLYVAPRKVECVGVAPTMCLQVKYSPDEEYQNFFGGIDGFFFVPGYNYELRVRTYDIPNPPADGSSIGYQLEEVVSKTPAYTGEALTLTGRDWVLLSFGEEDTVAFDPAVMSVNAIFGEDGQVSGNSGCNQYGGAYTLDGDTIRFGALMTTLMACDESVMNVEAAFTAALAGASTWTINGNMLEIVYAGGQLVFESAVPM